MSTAMTSPTASEEPDSRTSSVGRKRGFNELAAANDSFVAIETDSSDEDYQPPEKRSRYSEGVEANDQQLNSTNESSPDIVVISDSSESVSCSEEDASTPSPQDVLMDGVDNVDLGNTVDPPPAWNPGVSVTIRTSLTDRTPRTQLLPTHVGKFSQSSASQEMDTAAASISAPKIAPIKQSSHGDESTINATTNKYSEELVVVRSRSEWNKELVRLQKAEKALAKKLREEKKEKPRLPKEEKKMVTKPSKNQSKKWAKQRENILAQLPSSFGTPKWQKEAEKIIQGLAEAGKDLMPREVADTAFNFTEMGRTFKLPQSLHDALPVINLAKLSFSNRTHSFVAAFLEENRSIIEAVDYKLLMRAFKEYVRLLYGHLPDRLTSLVWSSKHVLGPKAKGNCLRILDEVRKEPLGKAELEEARLAERESWDAELREIQAQVVGARKALILLKEADKGAKTAVEKEADKGAKTAVEKEAQTEAGNVTREAREAENGNGPKKPENCWATEQPESENPELSSAEDPTTVFDSKSSEMAQNSQHSKPYSMGRLLGAKRAQSQTMRVVAAGNTNGNGEESHGDRKLFRNQQTDSETMTGLVHTSDEVDAEQKPVNSHPISMELFHRYFPSSDGSSIVHYCLTCAQTDHEVWDCPLLTCASCGLRGVHFTDLCPKMQRCAKCHERGHQKSDCPEKLAATADEFSRCDFCSSSKHLQSGCHFLWRSFKPGMLETTKFVADIPVHCYCCGATGHFGSECGIRNSPLHTEGHSWSISNWKRYVNPQSHNRALSTGKDFSLPLSTKGKKSFNIRGSAQSGIVTSVDDDENIPFIRERVAKPSRPVQRGNQHIKFDHTRAEDYEHVPRPHLGPPLPDSRYQPPRVVRPASQHKAYAEDRHEFSYRPRDDSARYMRERSFSPPPRFHEERYSPRPGDGYHRTDEIFDSYQPYDRGIGSSNVRVRVPVGRGNHNRGLAREGPAQGGRVGAAIPQRQRQRNHKG